MFNKLCYLLTESLNVAAYLTRVKNPSTENLIVFNFDSLFSIKTKIRKAV